MTLLSVSQLRYDHQFKDLHFLVMVYIHIEKNTFILIKEIRKKTSTANFRLHRYPKKSHFTPWISHHLLIYQVQLTELAFKIFDVLVFEVHWRPLFDIKLNKDIVEKVL